MFDPDPGVSLVIGAGMTNGLTNYYLMEEVVKTKVYVVAKDNTEDWITIDSNLVQKYKGKGLHFLGTYMETADSSGHREQYRKAGFLIKKIDKDIDLGIQTVHSFVSSDRFYICSTCVETKKEFFLYQRTESGEPMDMHNHCMDAIRYAVHTREFKNIEAIRKNYTGNRSI